tara:strand:+ start:4084 stop:5253 length:1170 start_codon:yes stop_codon:yes gene_type:complete
MVIYDIIHGDILLCPIAKRIIDTIEFQRLRDIKQLGCCHLVFPCAVHTRFEHSLGVYYLAGEYISKLDSEGKYFTDRERTCICIAGLIHDIGHGPYSHLFDEIIDKKKNHEYRGCILLDMMNTKYGLGFSDDEISFIKGIINPRNSSTYLSIDPSEMYKYQIISNPNGIDVDRFDYLMRDIHMTGLNYGIEYKRIMNYSRIMNGQIMYSDKVRVNIEDFFRIRYIMYREVYNHRKVRCLEYMMKDYINRIADELNLREIIKEDNIESFIGINDSIIHMNCGDTEAKKLCEMIKVRNTYKTIGELELNEEDEKLINIKNPFETEMIIDIVKIKYYGNDICKYYTNDKYSKVIINENIENKNKIIVGVYCKGEKHVKDIQEYFTKNIPIRI